MSIGRPHVNASESAGNRSDRDLWLALGAGGVSTLADAACLLRGHPEMFDLLRLCLVQTDQVRHARHHRVQLLSLRVDLGSTGIHPHLQLGHLPAQNGQPLLPNSHPPVLPRMRLRHALGMLLPIGFTRRLWEWALSAPLLPLAHIRGPLAGVASPAFPPYTVRCAYFRSQCCEHRSSRRQMHVPIQRRRGRDGEFSGIALTALHANRGFFYKVAPHLERSLRIELASFGSAALRVPLPCRAPQLLQQQIALPAYRLQRHTMQPMSARTSSGRAPTLTRLDQAARVMGGQAENRQEGATECAPHLCLLLFSPQLSTQALVASLKPPQRCLQGSPLLLHPLLQGALQLGKGCLGSRELLPQHAVTQSRLPSLCQVLLPLPLQCVAVGVAEQLLLGTVRLLELVHLLRERRCQRSYLLTARRLPNRAR
eukprot:scaffold30415_cov124-Isochrysis_galbana.AAC.15